MKTKLFRIALLAVMAIAMSGGFVKPSPAPLVPGFKCPSTLFYPSNQCKAMPVKGL